MLQVQPDTDKVPEAEDFPEVLREARRDAKGQAGKPDREGHQDPAIRDVADPSQNCL